MPESKPLVIDRSVLLPLGAIISVLGTGVWISWQAATAFATVNAQLDALHKEISTLGAKLENNWTFQDMKIWSASLAAKNPTLVVPEVSEN